MTFYNSFTNLNIDNLYYGNNPFSPQNSCVATTFDATFIPTTPVASPFAFGSLTMPVMTMPSTLPITSTPSVFNVPTGNFNITNLMQSIPSFNFTMPSINFNFPTIDTRNMDFSSSIGDTFVRTTTNTQKTNNSSYKSSVNNNVKLTGSLADYNSSKGQKLAESATRGGVGKFTGHCARYVKTAISNAGMGEYKSGHAYQMTSILANNPNFKQISPNSVDVNSLPAGCVLVFNQGSHNYSPEYGHTEITTGNGTAISDGTTRQLQKPDAIFIPV